jgi:hypothetical protein
MVGAAHDFLYIQVDIPAETTIAEWRRRRSGRRRARQRRRALRRWLRRLARIAAGEAR